jgi:two-component system, NarL family, nitrate/nitrite response regulator NarL
MLHRVERRTFPGEQVSNLTSREQQVVLLVAAGLRNKVIADELGLSEGTIKAHLHRIFQKLGIGSRCQLIVAVSGRNAREA